ncbi:hypothetical protein ANO11243_095130 [Dothideomycetidae sp. 11243]|nr:hypothetical protein ANO11243_095130 [fungal sp. No.11243]
MLLVHQAGSVRVGEAVRYADTISLRTYRKCSSEYRYTLTYTPSADRILPSPTHLYVKIKNTSPIALRAAYLHGPYSLYVSAFSSTFNPHQKTEELEKHGVPEFEPFLKAGSHWTCKLVVPEELRETGAGYTGSPSRSSMESMSSLGKGKKSVTWIIEVVSQVIFSSGAVVHYEVMVSRDERSLDLGFAAVAAQGHGAPGQLEDHRKGTKRESRSMRGVYSRAMRLKVEDTEALWNKPKLPEPDEADAEPEDDSKEHSKRRNKQKVHLVVLTHGLHSNLNADMLFLKESIDATVAQARKDARERRAKRKSTAASSSVSGHSESTDKKNVDGSHGEATATAAISGGQEDLADDGDEEDEEQVIVRGFSGNAIKTERGIQYLGKRLAKFVLKTTYPSQPYLPVKKKRSAVRSLSSKLGSSDKSADEPLPPTHHGSSIHRDELYYSNNSAYRYTSISFVGHSLGGLVQLYAIAYIQKHAPDFFSMIQPVNFVCMATPLLGLSNENPLYVKFALDFGLVGRTGQDLGLTWRAPTLVKTGWSAMGGVFGAHKDHKDEDPGAKPLLRVLPTGPAHQVLHLFRNRTLYSNVVNDGIVPLRTSCLLFLDWKGLGKVSKYRRENGLIGTMAEWGWAELTGANADRDISLSPNPSARDNGSDSSSPVRQSEGTTVPQPSETATEEDNQASGALAPDLAQYLQPRTHNHATSDHADDQLSPNGSTSSMLGDFFNFFRPSSSHGSPRVSSPHLSSSSKMSSPLSPKIGSPKVEHERKRPKALRAIQRAQTLSVDSEDADEPAKSSTDRPAISRGTTDNPTMRPDKSRPSASRGDSVEHAAHELSAPPKTSVFESASDLLHPPLPSTQWIIDPDFRPRTIFHDRVYHPSDIPPPPVRRPSLLARSFSSDKTITLTRPKSPSLRSAGSNSSLRSDQGGMKVEEKIARAYHRDLSWRKVLVTLEPDAHNNMIVRRMFANAYGWPVVKHLCDTHFSDSWSARTRDENETNVDRANSDLPSTASSPPDNEVTRGRRTGEEVANQTSKKPPPRRDSEIREKRDELGDLDRSTADISAIEARHRHEPDASWDGHFFSGSESDSDDGNEVSDKRTPSDTPSVPRLFTPVRPPSSNKRLSPQRHVLHSSTSSKGKKHDDPDLVTPDIILDPAADREHFTTEPESLGGSRRESLAEDKDLAPTSPGDVGLRMDVNEAMSGRGVADGVREEGHGLGILERITNAVGGKRKSDGEADALQR